MVNRPSFVLLLASLVLVTAAKAQRTDDSPPWRKGMFFASVGGSWKAKEYRVKNTLRWSIDPQVAFFVNDWLSVGLGGTFGFDEFNYTETNVITGITRSNLQEGRWWGLGPTVRGHLGSSKFGLFAQLSAHFGELEKNTENNFTDLDDTYLREQGSFQMYTFSPGAAYYFSPKFGAEVMAHAWWTLADVRSGNVTDNGQVEQFNSARYDATGGGWSVNLIYFFSLAQGADQ